MNNSTITEQSKQPVIIDHCSVNKKEKNINKAEYNCPSIFEALDEKEELMLPCLIDITDDNIKNILPTQNRKETLTDKLTNEEVYLERTISVFSSSVNTKSEKIIEKPSSTQVSTPDTDLMRSFSPSTSEEDEHKVVSKPHRERKSRSKDGKPKRNRTTFKQLQLISMKELFDKEKNPDSKAIQLLSEDVGLTKRVLQVWFQNARAKHKRGQCILTVDKTGLGAEEKEEEEEQEEENKNENIKISHMSGDVIETTLEE